MKNKKIDKSGILTKHWVYLGIFLKYNYNFTLFQRVKKGKKKNCV